MNDERPFPDMDLYTLEEDSTQMIVILHNKQYNQIYELYLKGENIENDSIMIQKNFEIVPYIECPWKEFVSSFPEITCFPYRQENYFPAIISHILIDNEYEKCHVIENLEQGKTDINRPYCSYYWYDENGELHSPYPNYPAILLHSGKEDDDDKNMNPYLNGFAFYNHGLVHRENDLPATFHNLKGCEFKRNGKYFRENDKLPVMSNICGSQIEKLWIWNKTGNKKKYIGCFFHGGCKYKGGCENPIYYDEENGNEITDIQKIKEIEENDITDQDDFDCCLYE